MTKAELIEEVAKVASLTKKETELIVNTVFDNITIPGGGANGPPHTDFVAWSGSPHSGLSSP